MQTAVDCSSDGVSLPCCVQRCRHDGDGTTTIPSLFPFCALSTTTAKAAPCVVFRTYCAALYALRSLGQVTDESIAHHLVQRAAKSLLGAAFQHAVHGVVLDGHVELIIRDGQYRLSVFDRGRFDSRTTIRISDPPTAEEEAVRGRDFA
jgi:hypothetical protein